jgi:hypothetical protein
MKEKKIKSAIIEIMNSDSIERESLMNEMAEAILSALGTFNAIQMGVLTPEGNQITGETMQEVMKTEAEMLREVFFKYCEYDKK